MTGVSKNAKKIIQGVAEDYSPSKSYTIDLGLTDNPLGPSLRVVRRLKKVFAHNLHIYPNKENYQELVDILELPKDTVLVTRGASGAIETILRTFVNGDDEVGL